MIDLHLGAVGEVSCWDSMLLLDFGINHRKLVNQIVLLAFFAKNCRHLLLQIADNVGMSLRGKESSVETPNHHNCISNIYLNIYTLVSLTRTKRALFTRSFSLRTAALRGRFLMSAKRSSSSSSISW